MSAENQVVETSSTDQGPQEFLVLGQEAPVEEVKKIESAPAAVAAPETKATGSEEQVVEENRDEKGRYKPGIQTRIDELTRARRDAERETEYWRIRAQQNGQAPAKATAADGQPPVRANFETDEAYLDALTDHKVDQRMAQRDQQQKQAQETTTKADSWQTKLTQARTDIADFDAVMANADTPVANHVAELIMECDQGAKVMHHLATHPEDLDKINSMSAAKAAFEIGKLATKFDAPAPTASSSEPAAQAVKVSKAPPPAGHSVGAGRSTESSLGDLNMDDYIAKRKSQGASWAR